jgi:hypothetical protein
VRWDDLFDDLAARVEHAQRLDAAEEVADRIRRDEATVTLAARVRATSGRLVFVLRDGSSVAGTVEGVGPDWFLVREEAGRRQVLLPTPSVLAVRGVARASAAPWGAVAARRTLLLAVRALAGAGVEVLVRTGSFDVRGTVSRVGADHVDVLVDQSADGLAGSVTIPFAGLLSITELG